MLVDPEAMEIPDMLVELVEMVKDEEIENDLCPHINPANTLDWCNVCFILNIATNVSLEEPQFTEETTPKQRETIEKLWGKYCNDEDWEDED